MTRMFGHDIRSDLLLLCLTEIISVFIAVYVLTASGLVHAEGVDHAKAGLIAVIVALGSALVAGASGLYQPENLSGTRRLLAGTAVAALLLFALAWLSLQLLELPKQGVSGRALLGNVLLGSILGVVVTRLGFSTVSRTGVLTRRIIIVRDPAGPAIEDRTETAPFEIAVLEPHECETGLTAERLRARRIWAVVVTNPALATPDMLRECAKAGVRILSQAELHASRFNRLDCNSLPADWLEKTRIVNEGRLAAMMHRSVDIVISLLLLAFTLPLMAITTLIIRFDSPGPILYRQQRVGLHGRVFEICKFRSMVVDAEVGGVARWATKQDSRITRFGRFMRLTRIDELPQIFTVLRGDMSFVGPRPERPAFVDQLSAAIPHYEDRACVKPGITGWAQVNYPYGASVEDARMKLAYDLYYVQRRSLFLDLLILVATVRVVLFQEGAR